jgi:hypothetical protein
MDATSGHDEPAILVRWGPLRLDTEPCITRTVVLLTVLVVALDDGVGDFANAAQVIIGLLVATFAAHLFASVLARRQRGIRLTWSQVGHLTMREAQYLLLGVVPVGVLIVGESTGLFTADDGVNIVIWLGLGFLALLGGLGGWRAGHRFWGAVRGALGAGFLGLIVLGLRIVMLHH